MSQRFLHAFLTFYEKQGEKRHFSWKFIHTVHGLSPTVPAIRYNKKTMGCSDPHISQRGLSQYVTHTKERIMVERQKTWCKYSTVELKVYFEIKEHILHIGDTNRKLSLFKHML
jgi:hypothetical protein